MSQLVKLKKQLLIFLSVAVMLFSAAGILSFFTGDAQGEGFTSGTQGEGVAENDAMIVANATDSTSNGYICFVIVPPDGWPSDTSYWSGGIAIYRYASMIGGSRANSDTLQYNIGYYDSDNNLKFKAYSGSSSSTSWKYTINRFTMPTAWDYFTDNYIYVYAYATCKVNGVTIGTLSYGTSSSPQQTRAITAYNGENLYIFATPDGTNLKFALTSSTSGASYTANSLTMTTSASSATATYGTAEKVATVTASGGASGGYTYSVSNSNFSVSSDGVLSTKSTTPAGTYSVTVTAKDSTYTALTGTKTISVTVEKKMLTVTSSASSATATYGTATTVSAISATGSISGSCSYAVSSVSGSSTDTSYFTVDSSGNLKTTASTPAGTYDVTVTVTDSSYSAVTGTTTVSVTVYNPLVVTLSKASDRTYGTVGIADLFSVSGGEQSTYSGTIKSAKRIKDGDGNTVSDSTDYSGSDYFTLVYSTSVGGLKTTKTTPAGTYTVVFTTTSGGMSVDTTVTATVKKADISSSSMTYTSSEYTYGGDAAYYATLGAETNPGGGAVTFYWIDSTNSGTGEFTASTTLPAGIYTFYGKIAATDNYNEYTMDYTTSGSEECIIVVVNQKALSADMITLSKSSMEYTGSALTQTVTVKNGSLALTQSTDYTVTYSSNISVGTATVTITAVEDGNYTGSASTTFTITPQSVSSPYILINDSANYVDTSHSGIKFSGSSVTPTVAVYNKQNGTLLESGTDYELGDWIGNDDFGIAYATVTFKGNYTGTATAQFGINYNCGIMVGHTVNMYTILKLQVPSGYSTSASAWTVKVTEYDSVSKYYAGNTGSSLSGSASYSGGYLVWSSSQWQDWPVVTKHNSATLINTGYVFIVATFKCGDKTITFADYVYHIDLGDDDNYYAVEDYYSTTRGKTIYDGAAGTTSTTALSCSVGTVSSTNYGTAGTVSILTAGGTSAANAKWSLVSGSSIAELSASAGTTTILKTFDTTPAGTYSVVVMATDGTNTVTKKISFTVNKIKVNAADLPEDVSVLTSGNAYATATDWLSDADNGTGFVVWDWTGFEYINGQYVAAETVTAETAEDGTVTYTTSLPVPVATLYMKDENGVIQAIALDVELTQKGTSGSYTYTASADGNYDISDLAGVSIGMSAYTDTNGDDTTTLAEIVNNESTILANIAINAGEVEDGAYEFKYVTESERDALVITEKVAALKAIIEAEQTADTSNAQEFYNNNYNNETDGAAITAISELISAYEGKEYAETDSSGTIVTNTYKFSETNADSYADFAAIEAANTFATAEDDAETDDYEGAKAAIGYANEYLADADYFEGLSDEELVAQEQALASALEAYSALSTDSKAYVSDELKALAKARKIAAIVRLQRMKKSDTTSTVTAIYDLAAEYELAIDGMNFTADDADIAALNDDVTGMVESLANQIAAVLALENSKTTKTITDEDGNVTTETVTRSDEVISVIDKAIEAVLSLTYETTEDKTSEVATDLTLNDGLEADVKAIEAACSDICDKIEVLQGYGDALTADDSALTVDSTDSEGNTVSGQKTTVEKFVTEAVADMLKQCAFTSTDDGGNTTAIASDTVIASAEAVYSPLAVRLKAVAELEEEKSASTSEYVQSAIDGAINKVLAIEVSGDTTEEKVADITEKVESITTANDGIVEVLTALEEQAKVLADATSESGKLNDSELLSAEQLQKINDIITENLVAVCALDYGDIGEYYSDLRAGETLTVKEQADNALKNITALVETFYALTEAEKEARATDENGDSNWSDNVEEILTNALDNAYEVAIATTTTTEGEDGEVTTETTYKTATADYFPDTDIAKQLSNLLLYTLGDDNDTPDDDSDDTIGILEAVITLENKKEEIEGNDNLADANKETLVSEIEEDIIRLMGGEITTGTDDDGNPITTTEQGYQYDPDKYDPSTDTNTNQPNTEIADIVDFAVAKADAAINLSEKLSSDDNSEAVKAVISDAIEKVFAADDGATDQIDAITEDAQYKIEAIKKLEELRDELVGSEDTDEKKDIVLRGADGETLTDADGNEVTVRNFLDGAIDDIKGLEYSGTDNADTTTAFKAEVDAIVDENTQKAKAIAGLEAQKTDADGNTRSDDVVKAIEEAKTAVNDLDYDYDNNTLADDIAAIQSVADSKIKAIEDIEDLIDKVNASNLTDGDEGEKAALNKILERGIDDINAMAYPTSAASGDAETTIDKATKVVENLTAKTDTAKELAAERREVNGDDTDDVADTKVNAVIADAIKKILAVSEGTYTDDTAEKTACESLKKSADAIIKGIESLEEKRDEINNNEKVSDDTKTERTNALNNRINTLAALDYDGTNAVDTDEINGTVDELTQKSDGIVDLDKMRLDDDGTTEKSDAVEAEIAKAIEAVNALTYTHDDSYDNTVVAGDIAKIKTNATDKITAIEKLEALIEKVEASDLTDEDKTALINEIYDGESAEAESAVDTITAMDYPLTDDDSAKIGNIIDNLTAKVDVATAIAKDLTGETLEDVIDELNAALDKVLALDGITAATTDGMAEKANLIDELRKLKVDGIKALDKRKTTETEGLSEEASDKIIARLDDAIEDVRNIPYTNEANTNGLKTTDEMKAEIAAYPSTDVEAIIDALQKVDAMQREGENGDGDTKSEDIVSEVQEALNKIDNLTSEGDALTEDIQNIIDSVGKVVSAIEELEELADTVAADDELSTEAQEAVQEAIANAIDDIQALTYDGDNPVNGTTADTDNICDLAEKKYEAIKKADKLKTDDNGNTRSDEAVQLVNEAIEDIAAVSMTNKDVAFDLDKAENKVETVLTTLNNDIVEQDMKDKAKAELDKFCEEKGISVDDERVAETLENAKQAIQDLDIGTATIEEFDATIDATIEDWKENLIAVQFRHDNPITEKLNKVIYTTDADGDGTADDVELLDEALEAYNELSESVREKIDSLYAPDYDSFESLIETKKFAEEFNAVKEEIVAELTEKKGNHIGLELADDIDAQIASVEDVADKLPDESLDDAAQEEWMQKLKDAGKAAVEEVKLDIEQLQSKNSLTSEYEEMINSGRYSDEAKAELKELYEAALENIYSVTTGDTTSDTSCVDLVKDKKAEAENAFANVPVVTLGTDGVDLNEIDKAEYGDDYDVEDKGYIGTVSNDSGMSSSIELVIKKTDNKDSVEATISSAAESGKAVAASGSDLTDEKIQELLSDKELKVTLDAYLLQNGSKVTEFEGSYTVRVLIPTELRGINNLQVVFIADDGTVEVFDTKVNGNYLEFTTTHFSDFQILGEKTVNLLWVALVLAVILIAEVIAILSIISKRKQAKKANRTVTVSGFAGFGLTNLLTLYLPTGVIPTIIVLAVFVVIAAAVIAVLLMYFKKHPVAAVEAESVESVTLLDALASSSASVDTVTEYSVVSNAEVAAAEEKSAASYGATAEEKSAASYAGGKASAKGAARHSITAAEAAASSDEIAAALIESEEYSVGRNRGIINLDTVSANYENGDTVTVDSLHEKGLIPKKVNFVKVLARGTLDKTITVKAQDFSKDAIKMIVLVGGTAIRMKVKNER